MTNSFLYFIFLQLRKKVCSLIYILVFSLIFTPCLVRAAASIKDTLSNSNRGVTSGHDIQIELGNFALTTNGSIKLEFAPEFNLTGLLPGDVIVGGGDVAWLAPVVNAPGKTIVIGYTGDLDQTDGVLSIQVGNVNYITNPANAGSYPLTFYVHQNNDGTGDIYYQAGDTVAINNAVNVQAEISQSLNFIVTGVVSGQNVNGATTNIVSTNNTIDYGTLNGANTVIAAQDLTVNTNATDGFTVTIRQSGNLTDGVNIINNFTGTNAAPTAWASPPGAGVEGYWGYTTDDSTLGTGIPNRFISNNWAGLTTSYLEIFHHPDPAGGTGTGVGTTRVGYKVEITDWQESGTYATTVNYLCTATY